MALKRRGRKIKQERAQQTRSEILDAAIRFFAQRGISNTRVVDLARSFGMTPGALYWHFPSKEDLLLATTEELHRRMVEAFTPKVLGSRTMSAREQLTMFLEQVNGFLADKPEYGAFFGQVSAESAGVNETVAAALRESMRLYVQALAGIIRYGQNKTREFRKDIDADALAHGLIGAHSGLLLHAQLFKGAARYGVIGAAVDTLVLDALSRRG